GRPQAGAGGRAVGGSVPERRPRPWRRGAGRRGRGRARRAQSLVDVAGPGARRGDARDLLGVVAGMTALSDAPSIDLLSSQSFAHGQPHAQFAWLRANDPVHWHDEPDGVGLWAVTRYREVKTVGR